METVSVKDIFKFLLFSVGIGDFYSMKKTKNEECVSTIKTPSDRQPVS